MPVGLRGKRLAVLSSAQSGSAYTAQTPLDVAAKICVAIPAGRWRIGEVAKADLMSGEQQDADDASDEEG